MFIPDKISPINRARCAIHSGSDAGMRVVEEAAAPGMRGAVR
jgi:hypothetical protein